MSGNSFFGYQAGQSQQVPQSGITVGNGAGSFNTCIGYQAGQSTTTGDSNVYIGYQAGAAATTFSQNIVIGAGTSVGAGTNVLIGAGASIGNGTSNVIIGLGASITGHSSTVAIGSTSSGGGNSNVAIGINATSGSGGANVAIGANANSGSASANCVVIGPTAGVAGISATGVTIIGSSAGHANTSGVNTFVGFQSGYTATSANATTTGTGQTCLGWNTGQNVSSATAPNYITCIGYQAQAGASGAVAIGTDSGGNGATSGTANLIVLGTANHTFSTLGKVKIDAHGTTSGALSTVTFSSATGAQVDTSCDRFVVIRTNIVVATDTVAFAISPDNTTYTTLATSTPGVVSSDITTLAVPAAWYVKVTVTGSATITASSVYY
jgi:hypothetical protein